MDAKWAEITKKLEKSLPSGIFRVWVAPLEAEISGGKINLVAPSAFMAEWVNRHLMDKLLEATSEVLGLPRDKVCIDLHVGQGGKKKIQPQSAGAVLAEMTRPQNGSQASLPIRNAMHAALPEWRYCFDDFVTGPCNNLAVAAAQDMCQSGQVRTLFVNSAPGLGKTHLAQAAGQLLSAQGNPLKVAYLTGEQFASRFVAAMRAKELEDFKQYLCGLDVLLLEDIHFLQRKKAMQEMALGVIKNLQAKGARVIFTSSFAPRQLQDMDSQLISLFCDGILANMEKPDAEMRKEILRRKARHYQVVLPDEVCDALSHRLSADVRQLDACLRNMIFKARLLNSGLTLDLAMATANQFASPEGSIDVKGIIRLVCESFGLTETQLRSRSRKHDYVQGRNMVFYLARKHTEMSLEEIGGLFNRRHSTVLRNITQIEQDLASDSHSGRQLARAVQMIEKKCGVCA